MRRRRPALSETVVTANRTPQPLSELVGDVSIIDRQAIERSGATGVADVLARVPGIEISRTGGVGNTTSLFIRGAETRFTAVYLDGVRIDSQSTGGAGWEGIPLAQIDRIEVLRGPAAAVYGSDAIGGVIQLFTRRGEEGVRPYAGIGFGSKGLRKIEGGVSGKSGLFDYSFGVAHEESKGFNVQPVDKRTVSKDGFTSPDRDGYHSTSGNVKLGLQITPDQRLDATLLAATSRAGYDASCPTAPSCRSSSATTSRTTRCAPRADLVVEVERHLQHPRAGDRFGVGLQDAAFVLPHRDAPARLPVPERIPLRPAPAHGHARAPRRRAAERAHHLDAQAAVARPGAGRALAGLRLRAGPAFAAAARAPRQRTASSAARPPAAPPTATPSPRRCASAPRPAPPSACPRCTSASANTACPRCAPKPARTWSWA
jgi:hypothetical protein